jgi:hypothetical protein
VRFILFCHKFPLLGDDEPAKGDMGGVETVDIGKDEELRDSGLIDVMSIALAEYDFGEGIADPVEAYTGRNSSGL